MIEALGRRHEELNEADFLDTHDYAADMPRPGGVWGKMFKHTRPCAGARLLVRTRINKCLSSLINELSDENNANENRVKCARLLANYCEYSESGMTGDAHMLVRAGFGAVRSCSFPPPESFRPAAAVFDCAPHTRTTQSS